MLVCITCNNFSKRDTSNQRLYLGRCLVDDIQVMICPPEDGKKESCDNYEQAPDHKERIAAYKEWKVKHPPVDYKINPGTQVGKDERPKPVKRARRKKK